MARLITGDLLRTYRWLTTEMGDLERSRSPFFKDTLFEDLKREIMK
jgi:hypothetical protein